jgi:uncharacterized damage-inducible protein DinB
LEVVEMKMVIQTLALAVVMGCGIPYAAGQAAPAPVPNPKQPLSPSQTLLESWNDIGRKLTAMAEDFPEDKYDFKPNKDERSFAEQLLHAANANYFFIDPVKGVIAPQGDPKRSDFKSKEAIVAFVRKSFAEGAALIKDKGDNGMSDLFLDPFANQKSRFSDGAWGLIEHSGEHYGQLVVYYRVAGLVPPESRPKK